MGWIEELSRLRTVFTPPAATQVENLLEQADASPIADAATLIAFHETLLFLRAYPHSPRVVELTERLLGGFARRVEALADSEREALEEPEVSGIAGTSLSAIFTYPVARWLAQAHPGEIEIDWERHEREARLGSALPRFVPLLAEDSLVEAHPPYTEWLEAAGGNLAWLIRQLERSSLPYERKAEVYDSMELPLRWRLGSGPSTRTKTRLPAPEIYCHTAPLLKRSDISLDAEVTAPPLPLTGLSRAEGETLLALTRDTSAVRYRELLGFTHGDPAAVWRAPSERGVEIYLWGVPPARRLPLRAYHAGMMFKNGVPVGYVEGLSFIERMEVGFNLYYTFREGETAWLYARLLRLLRQVAGVTCFSIDPYQIGHENEEAIDSGAFWFYRKLGFRPVEPEIARLMETEERKVKSRPGYRTPPHILRRLAAGSMIYESPGVPRGDWDRFAVRNLGLAVNRRRRRVRGEGLALVVSLIPGLARWPAADKTALDGILRAKTGRDEAVYLRRMQRHARLREALLALGSAD
ncbi:MAG: hypothetical protein HY822_11965 [Acidobacteria bacterium]|nr:hypothetical protein [Acidobacteriota bacterium]